MFNNLIFTLCIEGVEHINIKTLSRVDLKRYAFKGNFDGVIVGVWQMKRTLKLPMIYDTEIYEIKSNTNKHRKQ